MNDFLINLDGNVFKISQFQLLTSISTLNGKHAFSLFLKDIPEIDFYNLTFEEAIKKHTEFVAILELAFSNTNEPLVAVSQPLDSNSWDINDLVQNF